MKVQQLFHPLLKFSQWMGLAPFSSSFGELTVHKPSLFYSGFVFTALCFQQFLIFQDWSGTAELATNGKADLLDTYGFALTCLGSFVAHAYHFNDLSQIFNHLFHLSMAFPQVPQFFSSVIPTIIVGLLYEVAFSVISIFVTPFDYLHYEFYVLETFTYVGLEMVSFIIFLQFYYLVSSCTRLFSALNQKFDNLVDKLGSTPPSIQALLLPNLRAFLKERHEVYCLCCSINDTFGLQNLFSVTLCFVELTYACYNGLMNSGDSTAFNFLSDTLLWAGYFLYKLLATLMCCSFCAKESKKLRSTLHKVFEHVHDDRLKIEMIAVVTGYLVILVQSQSTSTLLEVI